MSAEAVARLELELALVAATREQGARALALLAVVEAELRVELADAKRDAGQVDA